MKWFEISKQRCTSDIPLGPLGWQDVEEMVQELEACDSECLRYQVCV